jgi:hypothetical protein
VGNKEVVVWAPTSRESKRPPHKRSRKGVALLALVAVGGTVGWASQKGEPGQDNCTNVNHQLVEVGTKGFKNQVRGVLDLVGVVNDERSLTGVAEALSNERGWEVSPERLAAVNKGNKAIVRDAGGLLQDNLRDGQYCLTIPGPIYGGLDVVESAGETLTTIAEEQDLPVAHLLQLNPQLAKKGAATALAEGTTVRVDDEIDKNFVYRPMNEENINAMGDGKMRYRILMANIALMGSDQTPANQGDTGYFPLRGGTASNGKKYGPAEVWAAYSPNFAPINVENSQINKKTIKKPKIPKPSIKKPTPKKPTPERPGSTSGEIRAGRTVSYTTSGARIPATINGYAYSNQHDRRWARKPYNFSGGSGRTIESSGCGPTSLDIVLSNLAKYNTTPVSEAGWAKRNGYRINGGTAHGAFIERPRSVGLNSKRIKLNVAAVKSITSRGGMVILNGEDNRAETPATSVGHIYVVYRVTKEGKFLVLDPNSVTKSMKAWSPNLILGAASAAYGITKK